MRASRFALLIPLLAGACATAAPSATRFGPADAVDVRVARVSSRSVTVQLAQPAHVAFVEVKPEAGEIARWVDGGASRALQPGRHSVMLPGGQRPRGGAAERACNHSGERPFYDLSVARTVASAVDIRLAKVRGRTVYCVRQPSVSRIEPSRDRHVLVLVSPHAADAEALEQARAAFNRQYAGGPFDGEELAQALSQAVARRWPGSAVYYVQVPLSR